MEHQLLIAHPWLPMTVFASMTAILIVMLFMRKTGGLLFVIAGTTLVLTVLHSIEFYHVQGDTHTMLFHALLLLLLGLILYVNREAEKIWYQ